MPDEKRVSTTGSGKPDSGQASQAGAAKAATAGGQNPVSDSLRRFEDAHINYLRDVRDAWAETQEQYNQAYQQHAQSFSESAANADPLTRYQVYRDHVEQLQKSVSPEASRKRFEEAYRNHLRALKEAWAKLDVDAVDLESF